MVFSAIKLEIIILHEQNQGDSQQQCLQQGLHPIPRLLVVDVDLRHNPGLRRFVSK